MRSFGRQCRGQGKVLLNLVRQTEKKLLCAGQQVIPLALLAQDYLQVDEKLDGQKQAYLNNQLLTAIGTHQPIEKQSRRLVTCLLQAGGQGAFSLQDRQCLRFDDCADCQRQKQLSGSVWKKTRYHRGDGLGFHLCLSSPPAFGAGRCPRAILPIPPM